MTPARARGNPNSEIRNSKKASFAAADGKGWERGDRGKRSRRPRGGAPLGASGARASSLPGRSMARCETSDFLRENSRPAGTPRVRLGDSGFPCPDGWDFAFRVEVVADGMRATPSRDFSAEPAGKNKSPKPGNPHAAHGSVLVQGDPSPPCGGGVFQSGASFETSTTVRGGAGCGTRKSGFPPGCPDVRGGNQSDRIPRFVAR